MLLFVDCCSLCLFVVARCPRDWLLIVVCVFVLVLSVVCYVLFVV